MKICTTKHLYRVIDSNGCMRFVVGGSVGEVEQIMKRYANATVNAVEQLPQRLLVGEEIVYDRD